MNLLLLKLKIVEKGFTNKRLCSMIGMNKATFSRKITGDVDFKCGEMEKISEALDLNSEEKIKIFFN